MFDMVVMDPPFLNEECLTKESVTAKFLSKGEAKVVLCSGEVMEDLAGRLLGLKRFQFTPKHKNNLYKKRLGSNAVKECETNAAIGNILSDEQATTFRALAARANYLALDRPGAAYATKGLCKCFAAPNTDALSALKHLNRYLVGGSQTRVAR